MTDPRSQMEAARELLDRLASHLDADTRAALAQLAGPNQEQGQGPDMLAQAAAALGTDPADLAAVLQDQQRVAELLSGLAASAGSDAERLREVLRAAGVHLPEA